MYLRLIFATPVTYPANERWAIWDLVSDQEDGTKRSEIQWFFNHWVNPKKLEAELKRIMLLPRNYIKPNKPSTKHLLKEANQLGRLIYPNQLLNSRTQDISTNASRHLSKLSKVWKPLYNKPNSRDLRLKGKAMGLETDFFRIYAIGVRPNIYIITGSVIKGTPEEPNKPVIDPVISGQFVKLNRVLSRLKELGIDDDPNPFFEGKQINLA